MVENLLRHSHPEFDGPGLYAITVFNSDVCYLSRSGWVRKALSDVIVCMRGEMHGRGKYLAKTVQQVKGK